MGPKPYGPSYGWHIETCFEFVDTINLKAWERTLRITKLEKSGLESLRDKNELLKL